MFNTYTCLKHYRSKVWGQLGILFVFLIFWKKSLIFSKGAFIWFIKIMYKYNFEKMLLHFKIAVFYFYFFILVISNLMWLFSMLKNSFAA